MAAVTRYSHSKLEAFESCPKRYYFAYVERPDIEPEEGVEAFMGSRVHEALEWLYRQRMMERTPGFDELLNVFETAWEREWHEGVRIVRAEYSPEDYRQVGRTALQRYHARYFPFDAGITIATERPVEFMLDSDGRYMFRGVIDRLDKVGDGVYEIHDYKTSASLPEQAKVDGDRQLALYQIAVEQMWPDVAEVSLVWHYLRFDTEIRSARSVEELDELRRQVIGLIDKVECCTEFEPRPGVLCDWCEYQELCPARRHLFYIRQLPLDALSEDRGVELVNRYVELEDEIKRLGEEKEELRQAIVEYGTERDISTLYGKGHAVRIWRKSTLRFPDRDHPDRPAFERWLKDNGLWERGAQLNDYRLSTLLDDPSLGEELRDGLARWGRPHEIVKLYPRKSR